MLLSDILVFLHFRFTTTKLQKFSPINVIYKRKSLLRTQVEGDLALINILLEHESTCILDLLLQPFRTREGLYSDLRCRFIFFTVFFAQKLTAY